MGFGPVWNSGLLREFEMIDFGYNTADVPVLRKLRQRLADWDATDPAREQLKAIMRDTVLAGLYGRIQRHGVHGDLLGDIWAKAHAGGPPSAAAESRFEAMIQACADDIQSKWFPRGGDSQWIHDSRLRPAEIEAVMVKAKLELCDLLLSGRATWCRWLGQCEWPEFSVRVSVDAKQKLAEIWVYGPDNGMPDDPRIDEDRLVGTSAPCRGRVVTSVLADAVPDLQDHASQRVPYRPKGPVRPVVEFRWQTAPAAPDQAARQPAPVDEPVDRRGPLLLVDGPIPTQDMDRLEAELRRVQGNILRPHGRGFAAHLLLRFGDPLAARRFLAARSGSVTTAAQQYATAADVRDAVADADQTLFVGLGLSAAGYRYLGEREPVDRLFRAGMKSARSLELTGDPAPAAWRPKYREEIHALVILAHLNSDVLTGEVGRWMDDLLGADLTEVVTEHGAVMRRGDDEIEPFGFVDNISQPLFYQEHVDRQMEGLDDEAVQATACWPLGFSPSQVLVPDGKNGEHGYGSYLVFRKLEQKLGRFAAAQAKLATARTDGDPDRAGGQLVGRAPGGAPALDPVGSAPGASAEARAAQRGAFIYRPGSGCPFAAHTRRMNDRTETGRRRVMARRGIPYNEHDRWSNKPPATPVDTGVGLLFQACVWDVQDQFADVQRAATLPTDGESPDPLLGSGNRWWADPTGRLASVDLELGDEPLVKMLGGEYFFLPSPAFLKSLAPES